MLLTEMLNILDTNIRFLQIGIQNQTKQINEYNMTVAKEYMLAQRELIEQELVVLAALKSKEQEKL